MTSETTPSENSPSDVLDALHLNSRINHLEERCRELESKLKDVTERFEYIQLATQDAVWDWDLVKNTGWYGDGLAAVSGHDPKLVEDGVKFWYDNIHPDDKDRVVRDIHNVIDTGGHHWHEQYRFKRKDGSFAWMNDRGYVRFNTAGQAVRMVGSMQNITKEVEAKEALRESEEKFKATFNQAAVGISISTLTGEFITVNKAYPEIFGYTEEELKDKSLSFLSHPDEVAQDRLIVNELVSGRMQVAAREKRYLHKSGRLIWGRVFGTVVNDIENNPKFIVGVLEDITEQRRADQAAKESEQHLRLAIDSAQLGTWNFDPLSGNLLWDARCKELFGLLPGDAADYEVFLKGVHPDDRAKTDIANKNAMRGVNNGEYDLEYRTIGIRDQKLRWIRAKGRGYFDVNGNFYRYAGTVMDITEQKQREQILAEQEERFRLLANTIPQIVWTTDENGVVNYMSDRWKMYTGQEPDYEFFSFRSLMHPDDLDVIIPEWNDCMRKGITFEGEYRLKNILRNDYRWYRCSTAPLKNESGKIVKWIGSATDIHDEKIATQRLEERVAQRTKQLSQINAQLEKSNEELEQYAYVTSHDLKEPVRKIQYFTNLVINRFENSIPREVTSYLDRIQSSAVRMNDLISDLLEYSRLSKTRSALEAVDLDQCLAEIRTEYDEILREKNISIECSDLPVVNGVPPQLQQLFENLVGNAIKFSKTDRGNNIRISSVQLSSVEKSKYPVLTKEAYHKITVTDEGIGFNPSFSENIFSIFHRLNQRSQYEGHGIGLSLCRKIVENHGGVIVADGAEGLGATFTIILPV